MPNEEKKEELNSSEFPDEESKKIMEDIEKEKKDKSPDDSSKKSESDEEEDKKPEKKEDAGDKGEKDKGKSDESEKDEEDEENKTEEKPKRTPKKMNVYEHEIAKKGWEKEKSKLETDIKDLKIKLDQKNRLKDKDEQIKKYCENTGMEEEQVRGLLELVGPADTGSEDIKKEIQSLKETIEETRQDNLFNKDYSKNVEPLFEKENILDKHRLAVKKLIKTEAFTQKYAGYDLDDLFYVLKNKGRLDDYIDQPGKKSGEHSRSGLRGGEEEKKDWKDMSDEEFDKVSKAEATKEKKFHLRRDGEDVS